MPIGIADEHEDLRQSLRRWVESRCPSEVTRAALDGERDELPPFWTELAQQGWLGIHIPEELGGQGAGLVELAVVLEELGRAAAPGPWASTALAASVIAAVGDGGQAKSLLPGLADGSLPAAVVLPVARADGAAMALPGLTATSGDDGSVCVRGSVGPILNGAVVTVVVAPVNVEGSERWFVLERGPGIDAEPTPSFDPSRRTATWHLDGVTLNLERELVGARTEVIRDLAVVHAAAEAVGGARWCVDTGAEQGRTREQFGRPIGQFQGVKHRLATMLASVEQSVAATWDAAQVLDLEAHAGPGADDASTTSQTRLAVQVAGALALDCYVEAAKGAIQVLGGMGFTWEHDAHIHLRRSTTIRQLLGGTAPLRAEAARLALLGTRRHLKVELPAEAEQFRAELEPLVAEITAITDLGEQRHRLADAGLLVPHWPEPWGREAGAVEQLVIDELCEEAGLRRPSLVVGAWALPTIIAHGTEEQAEDWVRPSLHGELVWCQLFSEPGAGSDLAGLTTRATKVKGGWSISGQKVWTSLATVADVGICLARTNPDVPKHKGITYFLVDMKTPGIEVRPLREITGESLFNEVFFDDVFVPDSCVVGPVDGGWRLARTTLANERVSLSSGSAFGDGLEAALSWLVQHPDEAQPVVLDQLGSLVAEAQSLAVLGLRATLRSLTGVEPGSESSVGKLLAAEFEQRVQEFGLDLLGPAGATTVGDAAPWARGVLHSKCLTIAGGTSEVQRNVIGERLLGLPRDPEPGR
ncbi:MAG TPA: acyl-CoA dehydrogenase [Acidimicrobiales bacterium]|nr:acyl-CoA dehydrogenase [Acidimicrobiales bacterium]